MKSCHICTWFQFQPCWNARWAGITAWEPFRKYQVGWSQAHIACSKRLKTGMLLSKLYWLIFVIQYCESESLSTSCTTTAKTGFSTFSLINICTHMMIKHPVPTSLWISSQCCNIVGSRSSKLCKPVSGSMCRLDKASWHFDWM